MDVVHNGVRDSGTEFEKHFWAKVSLKPELSSALLFPNPETLHFHRHFIIHYEVPVSSYCCAGEESPESPPPWEHQAVWCSTLSAPRSTVRISPGELLFPHATGGKLLCCWDVEWDHLQIICWVASFLFQTAFNLIHEYTTCFCPSTRKVGGCRVGT